MWAWAGLAGGGAAIAGLVSLEGAEDVLGRLLPVLVFLVAVTVLAELADAAGLFDEAAHHAATLARGRTVLLLLVVSLVATVSTVLLSLDTTAVLLTPVVLAMSSRLGLDPLPFAMATVWLAGTASLLLPVSNLTNLLAVDELGLSARTYAAAAWRPALVAVVVTVLVLLVVFRRRVRGRYVVPPRHHVEDRWLFGVAAAGCAVLGVLVVLEVPVAVAAVVAVVPLVVVFVVRRRSVLRWALVPWRLVVLVVGLFLVVEAGKEHGLTRVLADVAGSGTAYGDLLRLAGTAAGGANLVNNLPAYLAMEPVADGSVDRLLAVLVGVNAGPLVLLWGSLATLLWRDRCRARGLEISAGRFALLGLAVVPVTLAAAVLAI